MTESKLSATHQKKRKNLNRFFALEFQFHAVPANPSLNTQSCIKGLLVLWDLCFWAVWAAGPVHKKKLGADYEQLLRDFFHVFGVKKI